MKKGTWLSRVLVIAPMIIWSIIAYVFEMHDAEALSYSFLCTLVGGFFLSRYIVSQKLKKQAVSSWIGLVTTLLLVAFPLIFFVKGWREAPSNSARAVATAAGGGIRGPAPAVSPLLPDEIENALLGASGPIASGRWKPIPIKISKEYIIPRKKGDGPLVYSGISAAQMTGGQLICEWPENPGWDSYYILEYDNYVDQWYGFGTSTLFAMTGVEGRIILRSLSKIDKPLSSTTVKLKLVPPNDGMTRIRTETIMAPGEEVKWGPLPVRVKRKDLWWQLRIELLEEDGLDIPESDLVANPAQIAIGNAPEDIRKLRKGVTYFDSSDVEDPLGVVVLAPAIGRPVRCQVCVMAK